MRVLAAALLVAELAAFAAEDKATVARGEKVFAQSCSVGYCHGVAGAAGRGPRLRGRSFDHAYLVRVTRDGIPRSAMPGWKDRLSQADITAVVAYVESLAGASAELSAAEANPMPPGTGPAAIAAFQGPGQASRGHALFFDATRETRCGTCHALGGRGIAIGPDLSQSGGSSPKQLAASIRGARSRHTLKARLRNGEELPVVRAGQDGDLVKLYDLTTPPPVLRTLERAEIDSLTEFAGWSHSEVAKGYQDAELADIVSYLYWAVQGQNLPVKASELN